MVEFEADDALAAAADLAAKDESVEKVCIWTPDKDLAQCVVGERVVQIDRRSGQIRDEAAIRAKFGVTPALIPDYLALVGDSADGYPGIPGLGSKTAASLINRHGPIEQFPPGTLKEDNLELALLFKELATLRTDAPLGGVENDLDELRWQGPSPSFASFCAKIGDKRLAERVEKLQKQRDEERVS
jgi:5'-3' exonuclease